MAKTLQIPRSKAIDLFGWCGWKSAGSWTNDKLAEKFADVPDVSEGKTCADEAIAKTLIEVKAGIESGDKFEVVDDAPQAASSTPATGDAAAADGTAHAANGDAPVAAAKPPKAKKEKKPKEPKAPKAPSKGVRDEYGRGYFAGRQMFDNKMSGVSKADVTALNAAVGQPNDAMSKLALVWAYNAVRGYLDAQNGVPVPVPTLEKVTAKAEAPTPAAEAPTSAPTEAAPATAAASA